LTKVFDLNIVTIKYNSLNLPEIIQFKNGNQIRNLYDAGGQKLSTRNYTVYDYTLQPIVAENTIRDVMLSDEVYVEGKDYTGNVEYLYNADYYNGELNWEDTFFSMMYNSDGYCINLNPVILYYFRKDHLGNNREVWQAPYTFSNGTTSTATTIQRTQYYPSGLPWASNSGDYPWVQDKKYNGKEFVEMHGLDEYDSEARWYYPAIMRTTTMDPLAEKYYYISPYAWCANNPVKFVDVTGVTYGDPPNNYFQNFNFSANLRG
jgi:RHS repeat-associated protein